MRKLSDDVAELIRLYREIVEIAEFNLDMSGLDIIEQKDDLEEKCLDDLLYLMGEE